MKTAVLFTLILVSALLMGCTTDRCKTDCCCGTMKANCCGWDFYKPCRMLRNDDMGCGCTPCPSEIILKDCEPMDAPPAEVAPDGAAGSAEVEPAADPVADYGTPPDIR